jgi:hypothetical protein
MPGEREARGKGIYPMKRALDVHEMDSLPLAAAAARPGMTKVSQLMAKQ